MTVRFPTARSRRALRCAAFALLCLLTAGLFALGGALPRPAGAGLAAPSAGAALSAPMRAAPLAVVFTASVLPEPDDPSEQGRIALAGTAAPRLRPAPDRLRAAAETRPDGVPLALPERPPRA